MSHTVIGLFKSSADAQKAVSVLKEKGFDSADIDFSNSVNNLENEHSQNGGNRLTNANNTTDRNNSSESYNTESTLADSNMTDPNLSNPNMSDPNLLNSNLVEPNLSDRTIRDSNIENNTYSSDKTRNNHEEHDSIGKFFRNLFGGDEADTYSDAARRSEAIVTVHAHSTEEAQKASDIMDVAGAIDAHEEASTFRNETFVDGTDRDRNKDLNITNDLRDRNTNETLNVIREDLNIGKREVETGGVRLKSRIVERPVEESIRLRTEHVTVNRTAVNRPATEGDFKNFKEGEVEFSEVTEVPVVSKTAQVVEEVSLGREASERTETVRETLRNTEVDVEKLASKNNSENPNKPAF